MLSGGKSLEVKSPNVLKSQKFNDMLLPYDIVMTYTKEISLFTVNVYYQHKTLICQNKA